MSNTTSTSPPDQEVRNASSTLLEFLGAVETVVRRVPATWVKCELHNLQINRNFVRMEFIQLDRGGAQVAKAFGGCFPDAWQRISKGFKDAGLPLEAGSQILVQLKPNFDPAFGFQVRVLDIDLTFSLGDLSGRIQHIRQNLKDAGVWQRNRSLPPPSDFRRVAVISPTGAAGLGDFRATADRLSAVGLAEFVYFEAPFQTRDAPARILEILREIYRQCRNGSEAFCAVALIRGGGASADLAYLVDHKLTEAVCLMNIPVITGIGHERDVNLLDEVACIACDTPSKVANRIAETIVQSAIAARRSIESIETQTQSLSSVGVTALQAMTNDIDRNSRQLVQIASEAVRWAQVGLFPDARSTLDQMVHDTADALREARAQASERLRVSEKRVQDFGQSAFNDGLNQLIPLELGLGQTTSEIDSTLLGVARQIETMVPSLYSQVVERVDGTARQVTDHVVTCEKLILEAATRSLEDCAISIAHLSEFTEAFNPRTVLAAGYAIIRDPSGAPLTSAQLVRAAGVVEAEMRDGSIGLINRGNLEEETT